MPPTPCVIKSILDFPDKYYCGGAKGWLTDIGQAIHFASLSDGQNFIAAHNMYAIAVVFPITSTIISQFVAHAKQVPPPFYDTRIANFDSFAADWQGQGTSGQLTCLIATGSVTGTLPTMQCKMTESNDNVTYTDIPGAVFPVFDHSSQFEMILFSKTKRYTRVNAVLGGTFPSFVLGILQFQSDL